MEADTGGRTVRPRETLLRPAHLELGGVQLQHEFGRGGVSGGERCVELAYADPWTEASTSDRSTAAPGSPPWRLLRADRPGPRNVLKLNPLENTHPRSGSGVNSGPHRRATTGGRVPPVVHGLIA